MESSTSSAISHPAARSASSEKKLSRRGELLQPEPELGLPIFARAKFGSRDNADAAPDLNDSGLGRELN
jgi:hypothetical protein